MAKARLNLYKSFIVKNICNFQTTCNQGRFVPQIPAKTGATHHTFLPLCIMSFQKNSPKKKQIFYF
jgi:hypothetical protein